MSACELTDTYSPAAIDIAPATTAATPATTTSVGDRAAEATPTITAEPAPPVSPRYRIQEIERAVAILNAFTVDDPELGVTELAERVGLHKSTVHRFMVNLDAAGLHALIVLSRIARARDARLRLANPAPTVRALLRRTGADRVLDVRTDVADALED